MGGGCKRSSCSGNFFHCCCWHLTCEEKEQNDRETAAPVFCRNNSKLAVFVCRSSTRRGLCTVRRASPSPSCARPATTSSSRSTRTPSSVKTCVSSAPHYRPVARVRVSVSTVARFGSAMCVERRIQDASAELWPLCE